MALAPLQIVNDTKINTLPEQIHTPSKKVYIPIDTEKENRHVQVICNMREKKEAIIMQENNVHNNPNSHQQKNGIKKKKEKLSSLCKTPPSLIKTKGRDYYRGQFLGEGGFARCFQMKDDSGQIFAAKTVAKISIKSEKARNKLLSEIQIHKNMKHRNIVEFIDCFEDDVNVYILLEICPNGSLMDLLKKRRLLTEPEVRFFTTQICGALDYMHSRNVIHRDLKLGNIFFDKDFNLKIGDFGLAAIVSDENERKYTICGTPNYIAPEVIMGKHLGHSFEVDIWSLGVMVFAMIIGKPPFQAKEVTTIYERIKKCDYSFPEDKYISKEVQILIQDILTMNPLERPNIYEILNYGWFNGPFPSSITVDVLNEIPICFMDLSLEQSLKNFKNCMIKSGLVGKLDDEKVPQKTYKDPIAFFTNKFFQKTSRKSMLPVTLSPGNTKQKYKEISNISSQKELNKISFGLPSAAKISNEIECDLNLRRPSLVKNTDTFPNASNMIDSKISLKILANECYSTLKSILNAESKVKYEKVDANDDNNQSVNHKTDLKNPIIVTKWVDYSNKHGFAYQLSTEDIGVLFNNGLTILKLSDVEECWYIESDSKQGWVASHFKLENKPEFLNKYLTIIEFFNKYMMNNLNRVSTFSKQDYHKDDVFLRRYTRCNEFIMFELSDGTFQFNFKDHYKIVLSENGSSLSIILPSQKSITIPLLDVLKSEESHLPITLDTIPQCGISNKLQLMKQLLNQKSYGINMSSKP